MILQREFSHNLHVGVLRNLVESAGMRLRIRMEMGLSRACMHSSNLQSEQELQLACQKALKRKCILNEHMATQKGETLVLPAVDRVSPLIHAASSK